MHPCIPRTKRRPPTGCLYVHWNVTQFEFGLLLAERAIAQERRQIQTGSSQSEFPLLHQATVSHVVEVSFSLRVASMWSYRSVTRRVYVLRGCIQPDLDGTALRLRNRDNLHYGR